MPNSVHGDSAPTASALAGLLKDPIAVARVIDPATAWELVGVSRRTWQQMEARGETPPTTRLSKRRIGYRLIDLVGWLDARRVGGTEAA